MSAVDRLLKELTPSQKYVLENIVFRLDEEQTFHIKYDDLVESNNVNRVTIQWLSKMLRLTGIINVKHSKYGIVFSILNHKQFNELKEKLNVE